MKKVINRKLNIKSDKGFTMQDLIAAALIIMLFVGTISTLMYSVYKINIKADLNAQMVAYAVEVLEDIDKRSYDEITEDFCITEYGLNAPMKFGFGVEISNYGEGIENVEDIIKIVKITISYYLQDEREEFTVTKLKIREGI